MLWLHFMILHSQNVLLSLVFTVLPHLPFSFAFWWPLCSDLLLRLRILLIIFTFPSRLPFASCSHFWALLEFRIACILIFTFLLIPFYDRCRRCFVLACPSFSFFYALPFGVFFSSPRLTFSFFSSSLPFCSLILILVSRFSFAFSWSSFLTPPFFLPNYIFTLPVISLVASASF